jgi:signal transduction histidine kinase
MILFNHFTIRQKLIGILLAVTVISLLIGFSLEVYSNILASKKELVNNISLDAKLISDYSVPTILFDDRNAAENILAKLRNIPSILSGVIYDTKGDVFATYFKSGYENTPALADPDSSTIVQNKLLFISEPIVSENETIGRVDLIASTDVIRMKTFSHLKVIAMIFLGSSLVAFLLSILLERVISKPIIDLAATAHTIRESGDLRLRAEKYSNDETGTLYDSFNDLLISLSARKEERDRAEKALLEERENLEKRVSERTIELKTAKDKAEESDRLKSSFISNFSHEIRTPLNAIIGFTDLLLEGMNTDEEKAFAAKSINESKDDLLQLISNVLDTSSLETNQLYINKSEFLINDEIINIVKYGEELLNRSNNQLTQIKTSIDSTKGLRISTDERRLTQVLKQLVDNSVKYTSEGFIEIGTFLPDPKFIGFFVKDTGCGFTEEEKEKIFNRFYKIEIDKNKLYRGAGLGLTLAKGIIVNLNGEMWVESEPGVGTTFYFKIPSYASTVGDDLIAEEYQKDSSALIGKKILIAEDNFNNYSYLSIVIKRGEMEAINAKNGLEAVYLSNEYMFDLILMDILMPVMDGFEAARKIKIKYPSIPIIAQTAFDFSKDDDNFCEVFDDVLIKPIMPADLIKTLTKHLLKPST